VGVTDKPHHGDGWDLGAGTVFDMFFGGQKKTDAHAGTPLDDSAMWRRLLASVHPDAGGSEELFAWATSLRRHTENCASVQLANMRRESPRVGVTDSRRGPRVTTNKRNATDREMPYEDRPPQEAVESGEVCGRCFGRLEPGEAVGLTRFARWWCERNSAYRESFGPVCGECARLSRLKHRYADVWSDEDLFDHYLKRPCETCERTVYKRRDNLRQRYMVCCESCRRACYNRVRRERRAARARYKVCEVCDKAFTATRSDQKTCSAACRQKAYRQRNKVVG
jgi:hypothetical protein